MFKFWHRYRNIIIVCLITLSFISPLWLANLVYYKGNRLITHTTNHGILLNPSIDMRQTTLKNLNGKPFDINKLKGQWTLLALTASPNLNGFKKLYEIRQIRLMLGKNMNNVQRMLLFYRAKPPIILPPQSTNYAGTWFAVVDEKKWLQLFASLSLVDYGANVPNPPYVSGFFIVDPRGQLIMMYPPDANPKDIMQDLRRLIGGM